MDRMKAGRERRQRVIAAHGMLPPNSLPTTPPPALPASHPDAWRWRENKLREALDQAEYDAWCAAKPMA